MIRQSLIMAISHRGCRHDKTVAMIRQSLKTESYHGSYHGHLDKTLSYRHDKTESYQDRVLSWPSQSRLVRGCRPTRARQADERGAETLVRRMSSATALDAAVRRLPPVTAPE